MSSFELNFISENNNNNNNINVNGLSNTTINVEENIGNMGTSSVSQGGLTNRFSKWVNFPLEEEEEDEEALPLLEELDINIWEMLHKIRCVLVPIKINRDILLSSPDFWGPMLVVLSYGLLIVWGQFQAVSWVFTMWLFGSFFVFLITRALGGEITYSQTVGIIGYSLLPIVLLTFIQFWAKLFIPYADWVLQIIGTIWSAYSAGSLIASNEITKKKILVMYPVLLLYIYLGSLSSGF